MFQIRLLLVVQVYIYIYINICIPYIYISISWCTDSLSLWRQIVKTVRVRLIDRIPYNHEHISFSNEFAAKAGCIFSSKLWQNLAFSAIFWYPIGGAIHEGMSLISFSSTPSTCHIKVAHKNQIWFTDSNYSLILCILHKIKRNLKT